MTQNKKIFGITGNTGSGKSLAAEILRELGGCVIDADKLSHKVILRGETAYDEITSFFGNGILAKNGEIDRKALGRIVFANKEKLDKLTAIIHPKVISETNDIILLLQNDDNCRFIVIDAPLLFEAGMDKICNHICLITANAETRINRITARDSIDLKAAQSRINSQNDLLKLAPPHTLIIENNGVCPRLFAETVKKCFMPLICEN